MSTLTIDREMRDEIHRQSIVDAVDVEQVQEHYRGWYATVWPYLFRGLREADCPVWLLENEEA